MLVHKQHPELLDVEILHDGVHVVVDTCGRAEVGPFLGTLHLTALAEFTGGEDGDGFCLTNTVVDTEFVDGLLSKGVQVVVAVRQQPLHQFDGALLLGTGANEDGQYLCIAQRFRPET